MVGWAVPVKPDKAIVWVVAVAVNWYQMSCPLMVVQRLPSVDAVAAVKDAVVVAVHTVPAFTVSVAALAQSSLGGATNVFLADLTGGVICLFADTY